jgi:hypothetical protein
MDSLKKYIDVMYGALILVLGGLLWRSTKKTEKVESDLAAAVVNNATQENDHAVQEQEAKSDSAVDLFRKLDK